MLKFPWSHIFPDERERNVILYVEDEQEEDVDEAIVRVTYRNGRLLEQDDLEDLLESIAENIDCDQQTRKVHEPVAATLRGFDDPIEEDGK